MLLTLLGNLGMFGGTSPSVGTPMPVGHPAIYYVKGKRKKSRELEGAQDAIKRIWTKVVAEVTALPKAVEIVQPQAKVILPLIAKVPEKSISIASLSSRLAAIRESLKQIEQDEEDELILMMGAV